MYDATKAADRKKKVKPQLYVWLARVTQAKDEHHWDWATAVNHVVTKSDNSLVLKFRDTTNSEAIALCGKPAYYTPVGKRTYSFQWGIYSSNDGTSCPHCLAVCKANKITTLDVLSFYSPSLLKEIKKR